MCVAAPTHSKCAFLPATQMHLYRSVRALCQSDAFSLRVSILETPSLLSCAVLFACRSVLRRGPLTRDALAPSTRQSVLGEHSCPVTLPNQTHKSRRLLLPQHTFFTEWHKQHVGRNAAGSPVAHR